MKQSLSFLTLSLWAGMMIILGGCQAPSPIQFPQMTWQHLDKIVFNLGALEIKTAVTPQIDPPYVGYLFPVSPLAAAQSWGEGRLAVNGDNGLLRYTILEASAVETALEVDQSLGDYFTDEQSERYDIKIVVELTIIDQKRAAPGERVRAKLRAYANRSRTVPEGIKLAEREQIWFEMVEAVMRDLNGYLEAEINAKFSDDLSS